MNKHKILQQLLNNSNLDLNIFEKYTTILILNKIFNKIFNKINISMLNTKEQALYSLINSKSVWFLYSINDIFYIKLSNKKNSDKIDFINEKIHIIASNMYNDYLQHNKISDIRDFNVNIDEVALFIKNNFILKKQNIHNQYQPQRIISIFLILQLMLFVYLNREHNLHEHKNLILSIIVSGILTKFIEELYRNLLCSSYITAKLKSDNVILNDDKNITLEKNIVRL